MTTQLLLALAAAPIVVGIVVVCLREPMRVALPAYAALIPFSGVLSIGSPRFGSLSSLVGILLGAGLVLRLVRTRKVRVRLSATIPVFLLLLGVAGATVLWSLSPQTTVNSFLILGSLIVVYVLVALNPVDRDVLRRVENGLLVGGMVAVGYALFQLIVMGGFPADPPVPGVTEGRFGNDLLGPNNQAVAFILPLVVCLHRSVTFSVRSTRLLHISMAVLLLGGIVMTGSRGGILATVVAVVVLLVAAARGRGRLLSYGLIGATVAAFVFFAHPFGLAERTVETTSSSGRTDIWKVGAAACPQYCGLGSGWGTFRDVYAETQASVPDARVLVGAGNYEAHDVWLLVAIELGVPGLVLLVTGLGLVFVEALRLPAVLRGPPLSALVATVFAAFFLSNLEFKFFWMALMMVALSRNLAHAEASSPEAADVPLVAPAAGSGADV